MMMVWCSLTINTHTVYTRRYSVRIRNDKKKTVEHTQLRRDPPYTQHTRRKKECRLSAHRRNGAKTHVEEERAAGERACVCARGFLKSATP